VLCSQVVEAEQAGGSSSLWSRFKTTHRSAALQQQPAPTKDDQAWFNAAYSTADAPSMHASFTSDSTEEVATLASPIGDLLATTESFPGFRSVEASEGSTPHLPAAARWVV
jgi:hypothetical protein